MLRGTIRRRVTAFTLIEMLVVIAILAVLMGLLMPGLIRSRRKARRVQCQSQLRQITLGMLSYADDHHFRMPPIFVAGQTQWTGLVASYLDEDWATAFDPGSPPSARLVFFCPVALVDHPEPNDDAHGSYGMNAAAAEVNVTQIKAPSDLIMLADSKWSAPYWSAGVDFDNGTFPDDLHSHGANFSFMDGHVAWLPQSNYTTNDYIWTGAK